MRKFLQGAQWGNVLLLLAQILNQAGGVFPALAVHPAVLVTQAIIAALLPSLNIPVVGSISHKIAGTEVVQKS